MLALLLKDDRVAGRAFFSEEVQALVLQKLQPSHKKVSATLELLLPS